MEGVIEFSLGIVSLLFHKTCIKAPLHTKLTLMDCGIGNTNLLGSSSSVLGYDCFYMKSTDGATMYFKLEAGEFKLIIEWN